MIDVRPDLEVRLRRQRGRVRAPVRTSRIPPAAGRTNRRWSHLFRGDPSVWTTVPNARLGTRSRTRRAVGRPLRRSSHAFADDPRRAGGLALEGVLAGWVETQDVASLPGAVRRAWAELVVEAGRAGEACGVEVLGIDTLRANDATRARMRNESIGFVFQAFNLLDHTSVLENVTLPSSFAKTGRDVRGRGVRRRHRSHGVRPAGRRHAGGARSAPGVQAAPAPLRRGRFARTAPHGGDRTGAGRRGPCGACGV